MGSARVPESNKDYIQQVKKLKRFLYQGGGNYAFATATHEGSILPLNESLRAELYSEGKRLNVLFLNPKQDDTAFFQIKSASTGADALVVVNLHDYLPGLPGEEREEAKVFLEGLNFAREGLQDIGIPIIFWIPKMDAYLVTNHATDLYSMRRMHLWIEQTPQNDISDLKLLFPPPRVFSKASYLSKIGSYFSEFLAKMQEAKAIGYPRPKIFRQFIIPLAIYYIDKGNQHDLSSLLEEFSLEFEESARDGSEATAALAYFLNKLDLAEKILNNFLRDPDMPHTFESIISIQMMIASLKEESGDQQTAFALFKKYFSSSLNWHDDQRFYSMVKLSILTSAAHEYIRLAIELDKYDEAELALNQYSLAKKSEKDKPYNPLRFDYIPIHKQMDFAIFEAAIQLAKGNYSHSLSSLSKAKPYLKGGLWMLIQPLENYSWVNIFMIGAKIYAELGEPGKATFFASEIDELLSQALIGIQDFDEPISDELYEEAQSQVAFITGLYQNFLNQIMKP